MTLEIGRILAGKYRVERLLGQGGMGVVLAVRHLELHEEFAIKLMQGREFANPRAVERFLREARAAVRLRSKTEHIVQVHDVGRIESGEPYIVMELLSGQDLSDLLVSRGVLPIHEACEYLMQAGQALDAAHQLGIIHRDLKPANLFLTRRRDGSSCIKVLDFGISKQVVSGDDSAETEITGTQDVMGSPLYMSPELAKAARNASPQSDIWALGAILYKLLTGRAPFQCPSPAELFAALLGPGAAPKPTEFRGDVPLGLENVILRCLEKNPALRYASVAAFMADLAPFAVANAAMPSKKTRRPSFVEGLPLGFELQPPPTPAPIVPQSEFAVPGPTILQSPTCTPTLPAAVLQAENSEKRPTIPMPDRTGSTWGGTQSFSTPKNRRLGVVAGLAGITIVGMSVALGVGFSKPTEIVTTNSSNAELLLSPSVPMLQDSAESNKIHLVEVIPTASIAPAPPIPTSSVTIIPSATPKSSAVPKTTKSTTTKKKSRYDSFVF